MTEPDGIPDGENDFDGDQISNALEFRNGTSPLGGLYAFPDSTFRMSIAATPDPREWVLRWNVVDDRSIRYQVEYSRDLKRWSGHKQPFTAEENQKSLETVFRTLASPHPLYFRVRQVSSEAP